jgi:hypothetical protein
MAKRKSISKKTRFEVFKRDSFTCQYCGRSAPDVVLEVDHIKPVFDGGDDSIMNFITSCFDCNRGKGKYKLNDQSELAKQRQQLKELNEKRQQLEMMMEWKKELLNSKEQELNDACDFWKKLMNEHYWLNKNGRDSLRGYLNKYSFAEVITCMEISVNQYVEYEDGKPTEESVEKAFSYIPRICYSRKLQSQKPYMSDLWHIKNILRKKLPYFDERKAMIWLERAYKSGVEVEILKDVAFEVECWNDFQYAMADLLGDDYIG